jgi:hypothetical protein
MATLQVEMLRAVSKLPTMLFTVAHGRSDMTSHGVMGIPGVFFKYVISQDVF